MTIVSPYLPGGLTLNVVQPLVGARNYGLFYMVRPDGYKIAPAKFRAVTDSISQADGATLQLPFIDGLVATMRIEYWTNLRDANGDMTPACDDDARLMNDTLVGVLNSLRQWTSDPNTMQRYLWTPSGTSGVQRFINNVVLAAWPEPTQDPPIVSQTFSLGTPYPYALADDEATDVISAGGSAVVTNGGNADFSPVYRVSSGSTITAFTITNVDTGLVISYDSTRPGAVTIATGHYAEIDTFRGSIFLDGSGADLVAGLDPAVTEMFPLIPGAQTVAVTGADVSVIHNSAWL